IFIIMLLGGCQLMENSEAQKPSEMNEEELPDVQAFEDEFTRDFLQSTEETEEGFYPFLSGTGKYKMDFPAGGLIDDKSYSKRKNGYEEVHISIEDNTGFGMDVHYYSHHTKDGLDTFLDNFKGRLGYEGEFEELPKGDKTIHYAYEEDDVFRTFAGYILNEEGKGALEVIYNIDCQDEKEKECKENEKSDKERATKWMESVEFLDGSEDAE
ncbi:MAG TPA: hypothetical protein VK105_17905, partial [Virgibacillus sp.]